MAYSFRAQQRLEELQGQPAYPTDKFYDPELSPDGPILLSTADNTLMSRELLKHIQEHFHFTERHLKYRYSLIRGHEKDTTEILPPFLNRTLKPTAAIKPEHIVIGAGIGALFTQLIWHLCDDGDGVLLTAPFYAHYAWGITYPARAVVVSVTLPETVDPFSPEIFPHIRRKIEEKAAEGVKVKVLILNNPHNPLGRCYPKETILGYAELASELGLHFVVDELFANQVFSTSPHTTPFISCLSLDLGSAAARTYVLAGPTKDLGASGVKAGALIAQHNPDILRLIRWSLATMPISSASDAIFTSILRDEQFVEWFLEENRRRLREAYEFVTGWCDFQGVSYEEAQAGVFFVADFVSLINVHGSEEASDEKKMEVTLAALEKGGIELTSTKECGDPISTRCRIVFAIPREVMNVVLSRMEKVFRLPHWELTSATTEHPRFSLKPSL